MGKYANLKVQAQVKIVTIVHPHKGAKVEGNPLDKTLQTFSCF
jgi:hypothetical protein